MATPIRKDKRNRRRIRSWMVRHDITNAAVAKAVGVSDALVSSTIGGTRNNRKVLNRLLELGCPQSILALTEDFLAWKEGQ